MSTLVNVQFDESTALVQLDDAATRNALSPRLSIELSDAVDDALARDATAIVVHANGPVFCSGGSLDELEAPTHPLEDAYRGVFALAAAAVPTIAVVRGAVVGAGVNIVLACDVVLASPTARFDPRFLDVGIHPGGGHLWRLEQRVGGQGAAALSLCGDTLNGEEAQRAGLVWRCLPDDDLWPTAMRYAQRIASRPAELVRRAKASLRRSSEFEHIDDAIELEREAQIWSMAQPFFAERVRAARERIGRTSHH
ncbi:MAG: Enoyl-CoA hydratase/isomerase [Actinomycetia bacterium]|nr:Enoyl-CoA hydratase/isomerase [Actinomycetes bacterium]